MRILHCADLHLGRQRLHGRLPASDFAEAFGRIVQRAIEWPANVFLIAGDLFDVPQIPPPVLRQALRPLAALKQAKIPVLAIEGNHDRRGSADAPPTWVRYLSEEGLLTLLNTPFTSEGPLLRPYDPKSGQGAVLEYGGIRFVGAGYLGAGTDRKARAIAEALPGGSPPAVLLLHAGPEYFVGEGGGFQPDTLERLRERFVYLALGHVHKPMAFGEDPERPWALNPGAPENTRLDEAGRAGPRGWAEVLLEPHALPGLALLRARIVDAPRRPVARIELDIAAYGNKRKAGVEAIRQAALKAIRARKLPPETAVRLFLKGALNVGRIAIEPLGLGDALAEEANIQAVEVNLDEVQLFTGRPGSTPSASGLSTAQIERLALEEVLKARPLDGLDGQASELAEFYARLKARVARGADSEEALSEAVLEMLEHSELPARMIEAERPSR